MFFCISNWNHISYIFFKRSQLLKCVIIWSFAPSLVKQNLLIVLKPALQTFLLRFHYCCRFSWQTDKNHLYSYKMKKTVIAKITDKNHQWTSASPQNKINYSKELHGYILQWYESCVDEAKNTFHLVILCSDLESQVLTITWELVSDYYSTNVNVSISIYSCCSCVFQKRLWEVIGLINSVRSLIHVRVM